MKKHIHFRDRSSVDMVSERRRSVASSRHSSHRTVERRKQKCCCGARKRRETSEDSIVTSSGSVIEVGNRSGRPPTSHVNNSTDTYTNIYGKETYNPRTGTANYNTKNVDTTCTQNRGVFGSPIVDNSVQTTYLPGQTRYTPSRNIPTTNNYYGVAYTPPNHRKNVTGAAYTAPYASKNVSASAYTPSYTSKNVSASAYTPSYTSKNVGVVPYTTPRVSENVNRMSVTHTPRNSPTFSSKTSHYNIGNQYNGAVAGRTLPLATSYSSPIASPSANSITSYRTHPASPSSNSPTVSHSLANTPTRLPFTNANSPRFTPESQRSTYTNPCTPQSGAAGVTSIPAITINNAPVSMPHLGYSTPKTPHMIPNMNNNSTRGYNTPTKLSGITPNSVIARGQAASTPREIQSTGGVYTKTRNNFIGSRGARVLF